MSDDELNDEIAAFVEAVSGFMGQTDALFTDLLQGIAAAVGFTGDASWPPSDEFVDYMVEMMSSEDVLAQLDADEGAEVLCKLEEIRRMRDPS